MAVVAGVIVAALVTAVVLASGDGGDGTAATEAPPTTTSLTPDLAATSTSGVTPAISTAPPQVPGETAEVQIVGTPLPPFDVPDPASDPAAGLVAPAVIGSDFDGIQVSIDPTDGQAKAIVFLAHWCPHCQDEVPRVQEWLDAGGGVPGVDIISVSTAVQPDQDNYPPSAWLEAEGWSSPVIRDNDTYDVLVAYGSGGFPYWVFVDAQGTVVRRNSGELDIALLEEYMVEAAQSGGVAGGTPPVDYAGFRAQPTACGAEQPPEAAQLGFDEAADMGIDPTSTPVATIATSCGEIVIELDPAAAPATVNSFVFLAESGYFDGTAMHRVVPGFVLQAGDPTGTGSGSPGYVVPDELPPDGTVYVTGTVAMANAGPGTTGSQFFITLSDVGLPADYSIFGRVTGGTDTLDDIAAVPVGPGLSGEVSVPLETVYIESVTIER